MRTKPHRRRSSPCAKGEWQTLFDLPLPSRGRRFQTREPLRESPKQSRSGDESDSMGVCTGGIRCFTLLKRSQSPGLGHRDSGNGVFPKRSQARSGGKRERHTPPTVKNRVTPNEPTVHFRSACARRPTLTFLGRFDTPMPGEVAAPAETSREASAVHVTAWGSTLCVSESTCSPFNRPGPAHAGSAG